MTLDEQTIVHRENVARKLAVPLAINGNLFLFYENMALRNYFLVHPAAAPCINSVCPGKHVDASAAPPRQIFFEI